MRAKNDYDIVIVGDQLSGYFLAAAAAQAGFKVLLVEGNPTPKAVFAVPSGNLLTDLSWEPVFGLRSGDALDGFLKLLGLYEKLEDLFVPLCPEVQLVGPRYRLDLGYDPESLVREFSREIPQFGKAIGELFARPLQDKRSQQSFSKAIAKLQLPVAVERFAQLQLALFSNLLPETVFNSTLKLSLQRSAQGVYYPKGGKSALYEHLQGKIKSFGGEIKRNAWVEELVFEKGQLKGVLLSSFEAYVTCRNVVGAMGLHGFLNLVPEKLRPRSLVRQMRAMHPKYWRFSFAVHVAEHSLPDGMGPHLVIADPDQELREDNFLQVMVVPKEVYPRVAPDTRVLLVRILVPYEDEQLNPQITGALLQRSVEKLKKLAPFLEILTVSPDPAALAEDEVFRRFYRFSHKSHIPASLLVYDRIEDPSSERGLPMDWAKEGLKHVWLCSRDVGPLYGLAGQMHVAKDLVEQLVLERLAEERRKHPAEARA